MFSVFSVRKESTQPEWVNQCSQTAEAIETAETAKTIDPPVNVRIAAAVENPVNIRISKAIGTFRTTL